MDHHRLRKYRGPETWRRVREAYLAGESARAVALRFDVGESNVRRKVMQEGWTRKTYAEQHDLRPMRGEADGPAPAIGSLEDLDALPEPPPWNDPATRQVLTIIIVALAATIAWVALLRRQVRLRTSALEAREAELLQQADPQADLQLALRCPDCGHEWQPPFDIARFLWQELHGWALHLLREVDTLAQAYHWAEADILAMSPRRRQAYLELCAS